MSKSPMKFVLMAPLKPERRLSPAEMGDPGDAVTISALSFGAGEWPSERARSTLSVQGEATN